MHTFITTLTLAALTLVVGCATRPVIEPDMAFIEPGKLPATNITLQIPGLGPCNDSTDRSLHLDAMSPVTVLVHGCFGSSGLFRGLAQVLAFHGQQTACFTYNDRDALMRSSGELTAALDALAENMQNKNITVIGHSQGALIGRKALISARPDPIRHADAAYTLVTVSGPFSGIAAAKECGNPLLHALSFGLIGPACRLVTGDKWSDITYNSPFIVDPGALDKQVHRYLKIATDERGSCRRFDNRVCVESDEIFTLDEQRHPIIDADPITKVVVVEAGHVEIVGDKRVAPVKLIATLQQHGILNGTEPERAADLAMLLTRLYQVAD